MVTLEVRRGKWFLIRLLVAIILFLVLIFSVGLQELLMTIEHVRLIPALGVLLTLIALFFIGAFNVWLLLHSLVDVRFSVFLRMYACSWAMSLFSPGQTGDVSLIFFMKRYGVSYLQTSTAYLVDKIITLSLFLIVSLWGVIHYSTNIKVDFIKVVFYLILAIIVALFLYRSFFSQMRCFVRVNNIIKELCCSFRLLANQWSVVLLNFFLTLMKWLVVSLGFYLGFLSFSVSTFWPDIGVIPILSTLVGYIPVSISGIGTVEITAVYFFGQVGIGKAVVLSTYLFIRALQYAVAPFLLLFLSRRL